MIEENYQERTLFGFSVLPKDNTKDLRSLRLYDYTSLRRIRNEG